ncbi:Zn(II)2Cys6 transcription factor [Coniochaeta ligniaria NRRL 30616]|uniref:Zn(II)2Cys6 transcription factor n=1 Tax=Coniochaeta ligniaria NRRL 30616 TaxID=1408157 RepID=A0A1J7IMS2_9PEZI|nr:Zn(II)2Cys6 transcription factor [Coniochaeta ligniaria NRRL 30616]
MAISRGCITCRQRHLKCDRESPQCQRCQASGRQCVPAPLRPSRKAPFRHGQNPSLRTEGPHRFGDSRLEFPSDQTWLQTPRPISFEDESSVTAAMYLVVAAEPEPSLQGQQQGYLPSESNTDSDAESSCDEVERLVVCAPVAKLADYREATLLRHFQRTLGPWLDAREHGGHFTVTVVGLATSCQLLLYACLALSARHLSNTTNSVPSEVAEDYHGRCIAILLPNLAHEGFRTSFDTLLAATVILRLFEQMSSLTPLNDSQNHLLAGSVYVTSQLECAISGGLAEASFWAFVVQDIQFALAYQIKMRLPLDALSRGLSQRWRDHSNLTEQDWVHRAIFILAKTVDHCYSYGQGCPGAADSTARSLKREIRAWETKRPDTFQPLYFHPADSGAGRPFPTICYTNIEHAVATQYICLSKALILQHRSYLESESPDIAADSSSVTKMISDNLGFVFGISLSAEDAIPARITACHTLCACSSEIRGPLARRALLSLLKRTELENGWVWTSVLHQLSDKWDIIIP